TDLINNATKESVTGKTVLPGTTVHDTATMTGQSGNAGGTVKYERFTTINCSGTFASQNVTVSEGKVPNSADFTPATAGSYSYKAIYEGTNGPPQNLPAESPCEPLTVEKASPKITTEATGSVEIGNPIKDKAKITGLVDATEEGNIVFKLYSDEACTKEVSPPFSSTVEKIKADGTYE